MFWQTSGEAWCGVPDLVLRDAELCWVVMTSGRRCPAPNLRLCQPQSRDKLLEKYEMSRGCCCCRTPARWKLNNVKCLENLEPVFELRKILWSEAMLSPLSPQGKCKKRKCECQLKFIKIISYLNCIICGIINTNNKPSENGEHNIYKKLKAIDTLNTSC